MDHIDEKIIRALQRDGRISNTALAKLVNLSESACLRRLKRLERGGVILGYTAIIENKPDPRDQFTVTMITLENHSAASVRAFELAAKKIPCIIQCYLVTGSFDYLLLLSTSAGRDFNSINDEYLINLPGVARFHSCFTLKRVV